MIDFASWTEKVVPVTNLQLDSQNARIPTSPGTILGQRELIAELVEHDNVYDLARDIADFGYIPVEMMIGVHEDGRQTVLEGNRRLAALKLLISPESGPEAWVRRFRLVAARVPIETIKKVRVLFAPTREAAAPLILQKHTRDQVLRWSPIMQARFYRSLARSAGLTPQEIADRYGSTPGEIAKFLRTEEMYEIACALDLPQPVRDVVQNPRAFPAAVLERLLEVAKTREVLGIGFDDRGGIRGNVDPDEFRKGYTRMVTDIANKVIDTRTLNRADDAEAYLDGLGADAPDLSRRGVFTAQHFTKKTPAGAASPSTRAPSRPHSARVSLSLLPSAVKCRVSNPRIREIFDELHKLRPVERYPNACAAMLRILLELSMGNYLDKTGKIAQLLAQLAQVDRKQKGTDWYPSWKQMLGALLKDPDVEVPQLARKMLNKLVEKNSPLDGFVHNRFETAEPKYVRNTAAAMEELLTLLLNETDWPAKPAKSAAKK
jgi:hypothetical protein